MFGKKMKTSEKKPETCKWGKMASSKKGTNPSPNVIKPEKGSHG